MKIELASYFQNKSKKKWQAEYIAPLQPLILAAFRPWGGSAGAGRVKPAAANIGCQNLFSHQH